MPISAGNAQPQASQPRHKWFTSKPKKAPPSPVTSIIDDLERLYAEKLKPLEVTYQYNDFGFPLWAKGEFDAKPMVMFLGPYSTGKTTCINHLLKCNYPGAHMGSEPTTDRFTAVVSGPVQRTISGYTTCLANMPFRGLTTFGTGLLSNFECSQMPHPLLEHITIVDTPGVLSEKKHYDFSGVISWFASKCDLILLVFDPQKLYINDEFKRVLNVIRGHSDKIRVVLNKADQVESQELLRIYGALLWSLQNVLNTPEPVRVYICSFNDKHVNDAVCGPIGKVLFDAERDTLLADLIDIPKKAFDRRINEFIKRARSAMVHAYIISQLKKKMPALMGKTKAEQQLISKTYLQRVYHLKGEELPNVEHYKEVLSRQSIVNFKKLKPKMIQAVEEMLDYDIPGLLRKFSSPSEETVS